MRQYFRFKQFTIFQQLAAMKVGTDSVLLGAWADCDEDSKILDIGTGTGILALMMAQRFRSAQITAIEVEEYSFKDAVNNFKRSPWVERIKPILGDFRYYEFEHKFDCIIANPPYYPFTSKTSSYERYIARNNELLDFTHLARGIAKWLKPSGAAFIIVSASTSEQLELQFNYEYLFCSKKVHVYTTEKKHVQLVMYKFLKQITSCTEESLYIRRRGQYTHEYKKLTEDFYLYF